MMSWYGVGRFKRYEIRRVFWFKKVVRTRRVGQAHATPTARSCIINFFLHS